MVAVRSFRELQIWQRGIELVAQVYRATQDFPASELYGLSAQMRRAAVSVPSNVAEGFRRGHPKEFKQFLHIALGSCAELETQAVVASELRYLKAGAGTALLELLDHLNAMIVSLLKKL